MTDVNWWQHGDLRFVVEKIKARRPLLSSMMGAATTEEIDAHEEAVGRPLPADYRVLLQYIGNQNTEHITRTQDDSRQFYAFDYSIAALGKEYSKRRRGRTDLTIIKPPPSTSLILIGIRPFGEEVHHLYLDCEAANAPLVVRICNCGERCREDTGMDLKEFVARFT